MSSPPDWRPLYPFDSHELLLEGHRYHYVDQGQGSPLLMVHGNPTWSFYWRNLIGAYQHSYRAIAPDHIGCGLSDKPAKYPYVLQQHIDNLLDLVERLDLNDVTLLAHDWGGAIGLGAAVRQPDRFSRIVLFNTGAFPPPYIPWRLRALRIPVLGKPAIQGLNAFARSALRMAVADPSKLSPAVRAGLLAPYDSWSNRVANYQFVRDIPTRASHPTWHTLSEIEKRLQSLRDLPVLLLWGMRDWCFNRVCLDRFRQLFPNHEAHEFEDVGHYIVEEAHDQILPRIDHFLGVRREGEMQGGKLVEADD